MTKYSKTWDGTKKDMDILMDIILRDIKEMYPGLRKKEVNAIFCEALARNFVQSELFEMIESIHKRS